MLIKLLVEGGNMKPGPALAQQLGPIGINIGKVISDINESTKEFRGIIVPVQLDVDKKTKNFTIKVSSPPTSQLIKKELGIELASGERKKTIVGNLAIEQAIGITKAKHDSMLARDFLSALKSVIGTCMTMGVIIESKDPKEVLQEISQGKYSQEIKSQKTEVSSEKKKELESFFSSIKAKQEEIKKKEEEAKAAAEAVKAATATAKPATTAAKPAEAVQAIAEAKPEKKPELKKK